MNALTCMPIWHLLVLVAAIVAVIAPAIGIPSAVFGARYGAKEAIKLCSQHWDCNMSKATVTEDWKVHLAAVHEALMKASPELLAKQRAAEDAERAEDAAQAGSK